MHGGALDAALPQCKKSSEQRLGMTQISRGVFTSDDAELAYLDAGPPAGPPIVLVHGFASTKETNWLAPGWIDTLIRAGRRATRSGESRVGEESRSRWSAQH